MKWTSTWTLDQTIHLCLVVLCASLPLSKGVASSSMTVLFVLSLMRFVSSPHDYLTKIKSYISVLGISGLFFVYLMSVFYTSDVMRGLLILWRQCSLFILPYIFFINPHIIRQNFPTYLQWFIGTTIFGSIITLFLYYILPSDQVPALAAKYEFFLRDYEQFGNVNEAAFGLYSPFIDRIQFSNLIGLGVLSCIWLFFGQARRKILILASLSFLIFTTLILGGRGGQVGLLAGLSVWLVGAYGYFVHPFLSKKLGKIGSILLLMTGLLLFSTVLPYALFKTVPNVSHRYKQLYWETSVFMNGEYKKYEYIYFTGVRRLIFLKNGWELVKKHPVVGVGIGDYFKEINDIYIKDGTDFPMNIHNQFLYIWGGTGLWGLLVFLGSLLLWAKTFWRRPPKITLFALSVLVFYLVVMVGDAVLRMQIDCMSFSFFLGSLAVLALPLEEREKK